MGSLTHVERLFYEAQRLPAEQREEFLRTTCNGDVALHREVTSLLNHAHAAGGSFLDPSGLKADPDLVAADMTESAPELATSGSERYALGIELGRGGSGVVYRATQTQPIRRTVAVKVLHIGLDRSRVRARFDVECAALALTDHPNIARILDAGFTSGGRPFLVMEHIVGKCITEFCNEEGLDVPARLALFTQACDAIKHAHQKGVVHRDLKPANIMVTVIDGIASVKIIDFSIAKSVAPNEAMRRTTLHGEVLGSLPYMAPEQLGCPGASDVSPQDHAMPRDGEDVDTRADVYALGSVLYEMLTQSPPLRLDLAGVTSLEDLQSARERMVIESPSARVRQQIARDRHAGGRDDRKGLARRLNGELDWITLKALEFPRARRYDTVAAMADDVRRHLANDPISVGPPSLAYRSRKFLSRNLQWVVPVIIIFALMAVSVIGLTMKTYEATQARRGELQKAYQASIAAADSAVTLSDGVSAARMLEIAPAALRGWEWNFVARMADSRLWGCKLDVNAMSMRIAHDGRWLAVGLMNGQVLRLDAATGAKLGELSGAKEHVGALDISDDGLLIAAGDGTGGVNIWDARNDQLIGSPTAASAATGMVSSVAFSKSGERLAWVCNNTISVCDVHSTDAPRSWPANATTVEFINDDQLLATVGTDGAVDIWSASDGALRTQLAIPDRRMVRMTMAADRSFILTCDDTGAMHVWRSDSLEHIATPVLVVDPTALTMSDDGVTLGVATRDGRIECWNLESGLSVGQFMGGTSPASAIAVHAAMPNEGVPERMFAIDRDKSVRAWNAFDLNTNIVLRGKKYSSAAGADDAKSMIVCDDTCVLATPVADPLQAAVIFDPPKSASAVAVSPDGGVVTIGHDRSLHIWKADDRITRELATAADERIAAVCVNADGTRVATSAKNIVRVLNVADGAVVHTASLPLSQVTSMIFASNGELMIGGFGDGVHAMNAATGELRDFAAENSAVASLAISRDHSVLAIGRRDGQVELRLIADGSLISGFRTGRTAVCALAFSLRDERMFVGTETGAIQVWQPHAADPLLILRGHRGPISHVMILEDGRLYSTSFDGTMREWDGRPLGLMGTTGVPGEKPSDAGVNTATGP